MRPTLLLACWLLSLPAAVAQDRRGRSTPGIVLDTGARMGNCDVLTFAPGGDELLAVGDDKVVRVWAVGPNAIDAASSRAFRWPIYREQTGAIYAMALSPDGARVAIGGHGLRIGLVAVLDRVTGTIVRVMRKRNPDSDGVTTFLAWSPDGKYVLQGTSKGELYRWEPSARDSEGQKFKGDKPVVGNWVRLITFLPRPRDDQFLVVTGKGKVLRRSLKLDAAPVELLAFPDEIRYAAASPDKGKLALARMNRSDAAAGDRDVDLLDVAALVGGGGKSSVRPPVRVPSRAGYVRRPTRLTFSEDGRRLAVGMQEIIGRKNSHGGDFGRTSGGVVHVWDVSGASPNLLTTTGFPTGYDVDGLAFRPGRRQIAVSGGPNHEVRLFDLDNEAAPPLSEIRSPGSCLWAVRMSDDGKYLAWRERLNPDPRHPNDRAAGPWRYFTLGAPDDGRPRRILAAPPPKCSLVEPLTTADGWTVAPVNGFTWAVQHTSGFSRELSGKNHLYNDSVNQVPQCYTFVRTEGKPTRLAVGHMWGISVYELDENQPDDAKKVRLARVLLGHQGSVMSVAPAKRGDLLVSTGRDQTICCWSLKDWPSSPELGARFVEQNGEVVVADVDPGSPAWEVGLTVGEKVDFVGIIEPNSTKAQVYDPTGNLQPNVGKGPARGKNLFDGEEIGWGFDVQRRCKPADIIPLLHEARTGRNHYFGRLDGKGRMHGQQTSLRQRPLWVFFPTRAERGSDWLAWRWRDYVYDSNQQQTDQFAGLQRTAGDAETPRFYRLGNVAGTLGKRSREEPRYYDPARLWKYVEDVFAKETDTARVLFADVEPPKVELTVQREKADPANPKAPPGFLARVTVTPHLAGGDAPDRQEVRRVSLWLNDYLLSSEAVAEGAGRVAVVREFSIPARSLRSLSPNQVRAVGFNAAGGFAEAANAVTFQDKARDTRQLLALCVGVSDYEPVRQRSKLNKLRLPDLRCSRNDASALHEVFTQHQGSELFATVRAPEPLLDRRATLPAIKAALRDLGQRARPDDWLMVYLSGHGHCEYEGGAVKPGSFYFLCHDTTVEKPETGLRAQDLHAAFSGINCHKLILMDACHSGDNVPDLTREVSRNEANFLIFTACQNTESANEPNLKEIQAAIAKDPKRFAHLADLNLEHGVFTLGLLNTLGHPNATRGRARLKPISAQDVRRGISVTVAEMLHVLEEGRPQSQNPVFYPSDPGALGRLPIFCAPPPPPRRRP